MQGFGIILVFGSLMVLGYIFPMLWIVYALIVGVLLTFSRRSKPTQ
jgi:hypothetical protein